MARGHRQRSVLTPSRDAGEDQPRIDRRAFLGPDAEPLAGARPEAVEQHVGLGREVEQHLRLLLDVKVDDALAAVRQVDVLGGQRQTAGPAHPGPHRRPGRPASSRHAARGRCHRARSLSPRRGVRCWSREVRLLAGTVSAGQTSASPTSISSYFPIPLHGDPYAWRIKQSEEAAGSAADETPATAECRSCGATPHKGARFCDTCGSQLVASVDAAEYKQVTVLFADVVRSMDIAAAVDVERLREIMTELVERSAAVVQRYGGTVEYTGDGVMALFGAPVALEDHAFRACLAALAIQEEANRLAAEVARRDGVALRLRVGLNSGRVIAGEIGSGSLGYAATGEAVGFAQRMESVAPPGGVMLSESTARLVEHTVMLAEPEWVRIKGADEPVRARRLVAIGPRDGLVGRAEASLVGRRWEMAALDAMVDRAIGGRGGVVNVVGPPGIGKSRVAREAAALAAGRGVEVFWTFCESHARDVPFYVVTRLLRAGSGVADLDGDAARAQLRAYVAADADPQDLLLLDDLLGIADPDVPLPAIDPDARRRRLTALINTVSLARTEPALFIIEDAHWIDAVSESMLADFLTVIPRTPSMVLITSRPEYEGALTRVHGAQTIALAPLGDSDTAALLGELLGSDPSVGELAAIIADRAAGNPFFAEEMVRELVQRGVLTGERGGYVCRADVAEVSVPATVQAAIEARIDRLNTPAKRTLNAASVIGARFEAELLAALGIDAVFDELLGAELIDQVRFTPTRRVRLPPPADPRGGLRIAAEIRSRPVAPAPGRRDPRA